MIQRLRAGNTLTREQARDAASEMLAGRADRTQAADFLRALGDKGETEDELLGMLDCMMENSLGLPAPCPDAIDVCGTGGDGLRTFNISTTAAFVVAASGVVVAKHGNRSSSSAAGSADIFEYFGYDLNQTPEAVSRTLDRFGICFMFAQAFHPAMRHVAGARRDLGRRTAFNLLGPLCNPARVKRQLIGVSSMEHLGMLPRMLKRRGARMIMTVMSGDGMDEFSTHTRNRTCTLENDTIRTGMVDPEKLNLRRASPGELCVSNIQEAARAFVSVLDGNANKVMTDTVLLNSAAALMVGGIAKDFEGGIQTARESILDGKTARLLERFVGATGDVEILEKVRKS